jgi:hypothetical protein
VVQVNNAQVPLVQNAAPCRYSVAPANTAVSANGGDVTVAIETLAAAHGRESAWLRGLRYRPTPAVKVQER